MAHDLRDLHALRGLDDRCPSPRAASWGAWIAALADLLLPVACAGCDAAGVAWCGRCRAAFGRPRWLELPGLAPVLALAPYAGSARATVLAYKERGRRDLASPLARVLRTALAEAEVPAAAMVPAPSRPGAARARGGDHVLRLAREMLREAAPAPPPAPGGRPVVARALALGAGARDSVGLDPTARAANLERHLRLRPRGLEGVDASLPTVLLDDVLTTGATARAASTLLEAAGRPPVAIVVLTAVAPGAVAGAVPAVVCPPPPRTVVPSRTPRSDDQAYAQITRTGEPTVRDLRRRGRHSPGDDHGAHLSVPRPSH